MDCCNVLLLFLATFFLLVLYRGHALDTDNIVSFTANGKWGTQTATNNDILCNQKFMCTPHNLTWIPSYPIPPVVTGLWNNETACAALLSKGITNIYFYGDSYVRNFYAAVLITLNGDYRAGSLSNDSFTGCLYRNQFNEKMGSGCGKWGPLNHHGIVCGGKINLHPLLTHLETLNLCAQTNGSIVLWSAGNHRLSRYGRFGINNATSYSRYFQRNICKQLNDSRYVEQSLSGRPISQRTCSTWWVSTHYRFEAFFEDEVPERVLNFNKGMRRFFDSRSCGPVNYIDVYNMTATLVAQAPEDAGNMTHDKMHWGIEVNLHKAQIILNAILSAN